MATKLKSFEFVRTGRRKYDWDKLLDGSIWQVNRGDDFHIEGRMFALGVYQQARRCGKGVRISVSRDGSTVTLQAFEK